VKYVLDTNVVARLLDNDARVALRFAAVAADSVGMPLVVLAEETPPISIRHSAPASAQFRAPGLSERANAGRGAGFV